jgi:hypothetical protein
MTHVMMRSKQTIAQAASLASVGRNTWTQEEGEQNEE